MGEESTELTLTQDGSARLPSVVNVQGLGKIIAASGYFKDARQAAKAVVKVLAGQELGFAPIFSMSNIHIIEGKIAMGAMLIAAHIRRSNRYDYKILKHTDDGCTIQIIDHAVGNVLGETTFNKADARRAGLISKNVWKKYPRNMYFSRAIANAAKWFVPHLFGGAVYTPEELGAIVADDGTVIIEGEVEDITEKATPALNLKGSAAIINDPMLSSVGGAVSTPEHKDERPNWLQAKMLEADSGMTVDEIAERMNAPKLMVKKWLEPTPQDG